MAVNDSNYFDLAHWAFVIVRMEFVEDEIWRFHEHTSGSSYLWTADPDAGICAQLFRLFLQCCEHSFRGSRAIRADGDIDLEQIFLGSRRSK